jgi:hypothetical protein
MTTLSRRAYADMFGPTTGDRVRLGDTELIIEVEADRTCYGDEVKFGGGKVIRYEGDEKWQLCGQLPEVEAMGGLVHYRGELFASSLYRPNVTVLLTLDETSYTPGTSAMGSDHPIAWSHAYEGGRAFYTALGHTRESYTEAHFLAHVAGGIEWAAGR